VAAAVNARATCIPAVTNGIRLILLSGCVGPRDAYRIQQDRTIAMLQQMMAVLVAAHRWSTGTRSRWNGRRATGATYTSAAIARTIPRTRFN